MYSVLSVLGFSFKNVKKKNTRYHHTGPFKDRAQLNITFPRKVTANKGELSLCVCVCFCQSLIQPTAAQ